MDITEFIAARLAEDEATANEVHLPRTCGSVDRDASFDPDPIWCGCDYPARALREVAAKRAIVELHDRVHDCPVIVPTGNPGAFPGTLGYVSTEHVDKDSVLSLCTTLRTLAVVYSDHPDYRAEWKP